MYNSIRDRLIEFVKYKKISRNRFASIAGLSYAFINNVGQSLSLITQTKIENKFPELNMQWLLTGEGEMLKPVKSSKENPIINSPLAHSSINGNNQITIGEYSSSERTEVLDISHIQLEMEKMRLEIDLLKKLIEEKDRLIAEKERMIRQFMGKQEGEE